MTNILEMFTYTEKYVSAMCNKVQRTLFNFFFPVQIADQLYVTNAQIMLYGAKFT